MGHTETYVDGIWFPSVSTILAGEEKPWLTAWREKWGTLAMRKMEMANKIGTEFHTRAEAYTKGQQITYNEELSPTMNTRIKGMMKSFAAWAETVDGDIHDTELKVISRKYRYSGTLDAVGTFNKKPMLYDYKTSARIYPDMDLQLVAYAQAYKEETGIELKQGMIVHVSKQKPDFKLTVKIFKLGKRPLKKFLKLRAMFDDIMEVSHEESSISEATSSERVKVLHQSGPENSPPNQPKN
jgi:hypothetical protein